MHKFHRVKQQSIHSLKIVKAKYNSKVLTHTQRIDIFKTQQPKIKRYQKKR